MLATTPSRIASSLIQEGPAHRADLARKLSVSRTAVTNAVDALLEWDLVTTRPRSPEGAVLKDRVCLSPRFGLIGAVVVDFTETVVGIGTLDGRLLATRVLDADPTARGEDRLLAAPAVLDELVEAAGDGGELLHTQLAVNTQADRETGEVLGGTASAAWTGTNPKHLLEEALSSPVRLENTVRLLALAEQLERPAVADLVYVQLSYGVAMGLVVDGRILGGSRGGAGELGHTSIDLDGRLCTCAGRGCLMQYIGRHALVARIEQVLGAGTDVPDLIRAAQRREAAADELLTRFGHEVGAALVGLCNLLQPTTLVIGGALEGAGDLFLDPVREAVRRRALPLAVDALTIDKAAGSRDPGTILRAGLSCLRHDEAVRSRLIARHLDTSRTRRTPKVS